MHIQPFERAQKVERCFVGARFVYFVLLAVAMVEAVKLEVMVLLAIGAVYVGYGPLRHRLRPAHEARAYYQKVVGQQQPDESDTQHCFRFLLFGCSCEQQEFERNA